MDPVHQGHRQRGHRPVVGETIIAPTTSTGLLVRIAIAAMMPASTISTPKLREKVESSLVRAATSAQTVVSMSGARICCCARSLPWR